MADDLVFNPNCDRKLARREMGEGGAESIAEAVKAHYKVTRTPYDQQADPAPASFSNYHFVRDMDSLTIPVIQFRKAYQHNDTAGLIRGLTRCTLPWGDVEVAKAMFDQINAELKDAKGAHDANQLWHYAIFLFEDDVCIYAVRAPEKPASDRTNPFKELDPGLAEGRYFRFRHDPTSDTPSHVFAFTLITRQVGEEVETVPHRVL